MMSVSRTEALVLFPYNIKIQVDENYISTPQDVTFVHYCGYFQISMKDPEIVIDI